MKSEELEKSLKNEFETYLRDTLSEIRQEIVRLEESVFAELEKQKTQLEEFFRQAKERVPEGKELDTAFRDSVLEHLRLARDEGAQIAAKAHEEAEEMERRRREAEPSFADLSKAIKEISTKTTQADILKSLISSAERFAACGALFVVKNERLIGWHAFGEGKEQKEEGLRTTVSPVSSNNLLAEAVNSLTTIEVENGNYHGDLGILQKIGYGAAEKIVAIPLVVRGRGVAVLYAENSPEKKLYTEALESLVSVTSMTVEILASLKSAAKRAQEEQVAERQAVPPAPTVIHQQPSYQYQAESQTPSSAVYEEQSSTGYEFRKETPEISYAPPVYTPVEEEKISVEERAVDEKPETIYTPVEEREIVEKVESETVSAKEPYFEAKIETPPQEPSYQEEPTVTYEPEVKVEEPTVTYEPEVKVEAVYDVEAEVKEEPEVSRVESFQKPSVGLRFDTSYFEEKSQFEEEARAFEKPKTSPVAEERAYQAPHFEVKPKTLADRQIELPVDISSEEERRYHNEARRFARLLVSEIKLYNPQKVEEGRKAGDLYERLREAIDRSREMYDRRVKPSVAAKFDYFHYELVHSLAEGDVSKLGENYPGPKV